MIMRPPVIISTRMAAVSNIKVCHLPHQPGPFVVGTIRDPESATGKSNVWLRNDRQWTKDETDPKCNLRVGHWNPPNAAQRSPLKRQRVAELHPKLFG